MAKICEICCEFIVLQDKRNTRYMDNGNENNISGREKFDMKAWMEEHPQEYGEFAAAMGEADLLEVFLLGSAAFNTSPEFQKRLENMIDLDNMDLDELLKILQESDFAEKIFGEQAEGSEWAKYRLPFAAWLRQLPYDCSIAARVIFPLFSKPRCFFNFRCSLHLLFLLTFRTIFPVSVI